VQNKNPTRFIAKKKQKQNKVMIRNELKTIVEQTKGCANSTFIYTPWAPSSKTLLKKLSIYMWPMFTHMHPCLNDE
jgi:hypothetical protein